MKKIITKCADETVRFGARLGKLISKGDIIALKGNLGSGKTTLVKGIAQGLGVRDARYVNSPSFVIVKEYKGRFPLYHFDVYRLDDPSALDSVGYEEFFYGDGASVIEWAEKIQEFLPKEYLNIEFSSEDINKREISVSAEGERYKKMVARL